MVEIPLGASSKLSIGIKKTGPRGQAIYNPKNGRSTLLILKKGNITTAYIMTVIADSSYLKNDITKLDRDRYNKKDNNFSGVALYSTPNGKFVSAWFYESGKLVTKLPIVRTATHPAVQSISTSSIKTMNGGCTDWSQETFVDGEVVDTKDLDTTCPPNDGGGGGDFGPEYDNGGFPGPDDNTPSGGVGGDPAGSPGPSNADIINQITNKPFTFFFDVDCATLKKWLSVAKFTPDQSIIDKLNAAAKTILSSSSVGLPLNGVISKNIVYVENINNAYSTVVNMDYFPVTVTQLPIVNGQRLGPGQFLNYIRTHINDFTDHTKLFAPYNYGGVDDRNKWNSTDPKGAIVAIDLPGPDDASVITSYSSTDRWTFTTIHEPMYGDHPVSGNRDFGYIANSNGSYTFYTRGVDRLTNWDGNALEEIPEYIGFEKGIPFAAADALWQSFQNGISNFVKNNGGTAVINNPETLRPDWDTLKDVLTGKQPLSTLSKDCPDF